MEEPNSPLSHTDQLLMMSLSRFYHQPSNMRAVLPYMNNTSDVSLRMIDWFVTNYAKKFHIFIPIRKDDDVEVVVEYFNVYVNYRVQLKAYSKQQFDPFRRRDRILLQYDEGTKQIQTTVGQLNFFRWLLQHGVLEYIVSNASVIEADMVQSDRSKRTDRRNRPPTVALALEVGVRPTTDDTPTTTVDPTTLTTSDDSQRRRCEISKSAVPAMNRHTGTCTVMFT